MAKNRKVRVEFRKNRGKRPREQGWTREFKQHGFTDDEKTRSSERVRAKGDLSRKRTIIQDGATVDEAVMTVRKSETAQLGRVLRVHGLWSVVEAEDGKTFRCSIRRVLKSLAIDERSVVVAGDRVWFSPAENQDGVIEQVEPRRTELTRSSKGKEHTLVSNVDQVVFVVSLAEPVPKPHLIDRYLVGVEETGIVPIICFNKSDLVDLADFGELIELYAGLGVTVVATCARTGVGVGELRELLPDKLTAFAGQSGVGKSSLLNAIEPDLARRVAVVSTETQKGRHTTTTAEFIRLNTLNAWVVDTPGIRQYALSRIIPQELDGRFPEFHSFVPLCKLPGCSHTHEHSCAVKEAVEGGQIALQRYETYLGLFHGDDIM